LFVIPHFLLYFVGKKDKKKKKEKKKEKKKKKIVGQGDYLIEKRQQESIESRLYVCRLQELTPTAQGQMSKGFSSCSEDASSRSCR